MPRSPISPEPLQAEAFAQFGSVIDKSGPSVNANQGSARKFLDVVKPQNLYSLAPSRKWAKAVVNLFSCSPRSITKDETLNGAFRVSILERHPFTSQSFMPIGLSRETSSSKYLVIVAPTLPASESRKLTPRPPPFPTPEPRPRRTLKELLTRARPPPFPENNASDNDGTKPKSQKAGSKPRLPGPGLPDLKNLRAFLADGSQGVTYGPGIWHSPMVVLGDRPVDFVVLQYANGIANEDCQELELAARTHDPEDLLVSIPSELIGNVKAKL